MRYDFSQDYIIKIRGKPEQIKDWLKEISMFMDFGVSYKFMENEIRGFDSLEKIVEPVEFTFGDVHQVYFKNRSIWYSPNVINGDKKMYYDRFRKLFDQAKVKMDEKYKANCRKHNG